MSTNNPDAILFENINVSETSIGCNRCAKPLRIPYKNHRYEVSCIDGDGESFVVGWTVDSDGGNLVNCINKHPSWHSPHIEDLQK